MGCASGGIDGRTSILGPPLGGSFTFLFDPCSYLHVTRAKDAASLARRWNFLVAHHFRMMSPGTVCVIFNLSIIFEIWFM